jgi:hypothetical protein
MEINNKEKNEILDFLPDGVIIFKDSNLNPEIGKDDVSDSHTNHMDMSQCSHLRIPLIKNSLQIRYVNKTFQNMFKLDHHLPMC